jgi:hypothetical protein
MQVPNIDLARDDASAAAALHAAASDVGFFYGLLFLHARGPVRLRLSADAQSATSLHSGYITQSFAMLTSTLSYDRSDEPWRAG